MGDSNLSYHWPFTAALLTFDDFCVFIIRLSLGHLQVLHAFVSCSTLYCVYTRFLVLLRTNK